MTEHPFTTVNTFFVVIFGLISGILTVKYYFDMAKMYNFIRTKYLEAEIKEEKYRRVSILSGNILEQVQEDEGKELAIH